MDNKNLQDLIKHLQDSRNGYKECSENVDLQHLKNMFVQFSQKRERMLNEIKNKVIDKTIFKNDGSVTGKLHQIFLNIKSLITQHDTTSIISEINRGENILIENYRDTLKTELPPDLKEILERQLKEIGKD